MATYKDMTRYACEITQQGFGESKEKGTPSFFIVFEPVGEIDKDDPNHQFECPNFERKLDLWLTENTVDSHIKTLRTWGFTGSSFRDLDPETGSCSLVGTTIELLCKHQEYNGKVYDKFEIPFEGSMERQESVAKVASKLDNLFGKKLKTAAPKQAAKAQPVAAAVSDEGSDDIPF